jgi:mono/diheme cytochrome c family protein
MTDAELSNIIRNGIKAKGMPPASGLSDSDVSSLIAYLRAKKDQN